MVTIGDRRKKFNLSHQANMTAERNIGELRWLAMKLINHFVSFFEGSIGFMKYVDDKIQTNLSFILGKKEFLIISERYSCWGFLLVILLSKILKGKQLYIPICFFVMLNKERRKETTLCHFYLTRTVFLFHSNILN